MIARYAIGLVVLAGVGVLVSAYPIMPWLLGVVLALYVAVLWRWPTSWLVVVPAALAAFDFAPWTGWDFVAESDLVVATTIAVLVIRRPPRLIDFRLSRTAAIAIGIALLAWGSGLATAYASPIFATLKSDVRYLQLGNAFFVGKALPTALLLLPFLQQVLRTGGSVTHRFGLGMTVGLVVTAAAMLVERAMFVGAFDLVADYRAVGPFSSMHVGGGHVGTFVAMAIPFVASSLWLGWIGRVLVTVVGALSGGYALIVSFARTAYAAGALSALVTGLSWVMAGRGSRLRRVAPALLGLAAVVGIALVAGSSGFMSSRLHLVGTDLDMRVENWEGGLALRGRSVLATLLGAGTGTFPGARVVAGVPMAPSSYLVRADERGAYVSMTRSSTSYFGQKVSIRRGETYTLSLDVRTFGAADGIAGLLCEKHLQNSFTCASVNLTPGKPGEWQRLSGRLSTTTFQTGTWGLKAPVELALSIRRPGSTVDFARVELRDAAGVNVIANGDFSHGTERWWLTDDDHRAWRILNQYLMTLFEGGLLGLLGLLVLVGTSLFTAIRAVLAGRQASAMIAGSLAALLCACVADAVLEAPRVATLVYLLCTLGLARQSAGHPAADAESSSRRRPV